MDAISLDTLADWVRGHPTRGTHYAAVAELFSRASAALAEAFGGPDFPGCAFDWPTALVIRAPLVAVWDFDYYQLSVAADSRDGSAVVALHRA